MPNEQPLSPFNENACHSFITSNAPLNGLYTQRYNSSRQIDGPLFRGRFKSILVDADCYLLQLSRYIHLNPVVSMITQKPEEYLWSSYSAYLGEKKKPAWPICETTLSQFSGNNQVLQYAAFVEEGIDEKTKAIFSQSALPAVIGKKSFLKKTTANLSKTATIGIHTKKSVEINKISLIPLNQISACVKKYYQKHGKTKGTLEQKEATNKMIIHIASHCIGHEYRRIAEHLSIPSYHAIAKIAYRFAIQVKNDTGIKIEVIKILKSLRAMSNVRA